MKLGMFWQLFEKSLNIKFNHNLFSNSLVVLCGQNDGRMDGQTDMTKLRVAFRNFARAMDRKQRINKKRKLARTCKKKQNVEADKWRRK